MAKGDASKRKDLGRRHWCGCVGREEADSRSVSINSETDTNPGVSAGRKQNGPKQTSKERATPAADVTAGKKQALSVNEQSSVAKDDENGLSECVVCCRYIVDGKEDALFCESRCNRWLHCCCAGVPLSYFEHLNSSPTPFFCIICSHQNHEQASAVLTETVESLKESVNQLVKELDGLRRCTREHHAIRTYSSTAAANDISRGHPSGRVGGVNGGGGGDRWNGGGELGGHGGHGGSGCNGGSGNGSDGEGDGGREECGGEGGDGMGSSGVSGRSGDGSGGRRVWRGAKREKSPEKHKSSRGLQSSSSTRMSTTGNQAHHERRNTGSNDRHSGTSTSNVASVSPKQALSGVRRVWGTLKSTTTVAVQNALTLVSEIPANEIIVKRKNKVAEINGNRVMRWWFILRASESILQILEKHWQQIQIQTAWKLEPVTYSAHMVSVMCSSVSQNEGTGDIASQKVVCYL